MSSLKDKIIKQLDELFKEILQQISDFVDFLIWRRSADEEIIDADRETTNMDMSNAVTTDSGLQYIVVKEGDGASPQRGDRVTVHYTGTLEDGTKFDTLISNRCIMHGLTTKN